MAPEIERAPTSTVEAREAASTSGDVSSSSTPDQLVAAIWSEWRKRTDGVFTISRLLNDLKDKVVPYGEWMIVAGKLPFGIGAAERIMTIARSGALESARARNVPLPASWSILAELARLTDAELDKEIVAGKVGPSLSRKSATDLVSMVIWRRGEAKREAAKREAAAANAAAASKPAAASQPPPSSSWPGGRSFVNRPKSRPQGNTNIRGIPPAGPDDDHAFNRLIDAWNRASSRARVRFKRYLASLNV